MRKVIQQFQWEKIANNYVLKLDNNHYISYNPNTGSDNFGAFFDSFIGQSGEETALVDKTNIEHTYRILIGDWRNAYEKLAPRGFEECLDFFVEQRRKYGGQWSTHENDRAKDA